MVNYCCVQGCGRNSRLNKHLNFYSLPKERHRQVQWLKAAGREELLEKDQAKLSVSHRFCSRHFTPASVKNRHLCPDAVPSLCLPGSWCKEEESEDDQPTHTDIVCNSCARAVVGFRYKCVSCRDYDLCQKCEMLEAHPQHYMLRIPRPVKFKFADKLTKKWKRLFNAEHVTPAMLDADEAVMSGSDSDDEPITKYAKNYDSGIDLSEDVKEKIRKEVKRVMQLKPEDKTPKNTIKKKKEQTKRLSQETEQVTPNKKLKYEEIAEVNRFPGPSAPEVVFADVNEIKDGQIMVELKPEFRGSVPGPSVSRVGPALPRVTQADIPEVPIVGTISTMSHVSIPTENNLYNMALVNNMPGMSTEETVGNVTVPTVGQVTPGSGDQPVMHVKLSDDFTELMIEVTSNNKKTYYKYTE
uniref:ZZ-type domain-containing protein n=1 Tax=Pectinophora gossypiella TaxID=13191 RepID=A0A1E1WVF3_PECGO